MKRLASLVLGLTLIACASANAQYFSAGSDPYTRWKHINTEHYNIIYPAAIDSLARVYAAHMEAVRNDAIVQPQQIEPGHTSVILHPYTLTGDDTKRSNSPLRLDIYTSPKVYGFMSEPWEYTTAIAKSRHLGHAYLLNRSFFRVGHYIIGDNARLIGDALMFHNFYWRGDETVAVTDLTHAGGGRNADFLKAYRTASVEKDWRNYNRWKLGSYKYYTPEPDAFGYILEANYRNQHDDYLFSRRWADSLMTYPLTAWVLSRKTDPAGAFKNVLFKEQQDSIAAMFQKDFDSRRPFTNVSSVWPATNYTEYRDFEYFAEQNAIYAIKSSLDEATQLVKIDLGKGTEEFVMFFSDEASAVKAHGDMLYWSETVHKGPWELEDYSEIFSYNTWTGRVKRLTSKTRYYNPALNESGDVMAVAEHTPEGNSFLTILSPEGEKELSVAAPDNGKIMETEWLDDAVFALIVTYDGLGLYSYDDDGWKIAIAPQWQNISDIAEFTLTLEGRKTDAISFTSDVDGVQNVYAYSLADGKVYKLINSPYGVAYAVEDRDGNLIYSRYGKTGYSLAKTSAADFEMQPVDMSAPYHFPLADKGSELAGNTYPKPDKAFLDAYQDKYRYPAHDYSKVANMFHIHSWLPLYVNLADRKAALGATVMSQNMLGTVTASAGLSYARSIYSGKRRLGAAATLSVKGTIPRFELTAELNTTEKVNFMHYINEAGQETNGFEYAFDSRLFYDISARIYQPLTYSMLGFNATLTPSLAFHHNNNKAVDYISGRQGTADYFQASISGDVQSDMAYAAIYPRWGAGIDLNYITPASFGSSATLYTTQYGLKLSAYLPGFAPTHGASVALSHVRQMWNQGSAVFPTASLIELPRGYIKRDPAQYNSKKYTMASIDYALPVYLGDTSLGGLLYFRRLQVIPFYDFALCKQYSGDKTAFYSLGTDLLADFNVLRLRFGLTAGVRAAYNKPDPGHQSVTFQFLLKTAL